MKENNYPTRRIECDNCHGIGTERCPRCDGEGEDSNGCKCSYCDGLGAIICQKCGGSGAIDVEVLYDWWE